MSNLEIVLGSVLILFAIAVVMVVLFQEGHERNAGAITGSVGDTYLSRHKSRSIDTFLERWTKVISVGFFLLVILANVLFYFHVFG
ncbi:MAG: preprotein translocase subunit SecG [Clostridia bacterium]|nr:preprotein translocase subunit SecG [Clostridia bacterium]